MEQSEVDKAKAYSLADHLGLPRTTLLIVSMFWRVHNEWGQPGGFLFITHQIVLKISTSLSMVF